MNNVQYIDRKSNQILAENVPGKGWLRWLYHNPFGKLTLNCMVKRKFMSSFAGWYMNKISSTKKIEGFVRDHDVNMNEYQQSNISDYKTFNQFFYRKIKADQRPIGVGVVSPADGKILAFQEVNSVKNFFVKGQEFTLESFLKDSTLAKRYSSGSMAIIRLAPADYHRFHFPAGGVISKSIPIKGQYYSVSPLALNKSLEIFCENKREYSLLKTEDYGDILYSEIGATMVGSIIQTGKPFQLVEKGSEKGYFAFGGSTIVLLFERGKVKFDADILENTSKGFETSIRMGESIAQ